MIDRKISNKELAQKGLVVDGVEILPPSTEKTLDQLRAKRMLKFYKIFGRIYYQESDLIEYAKSKKVEAVA